MRSMEELTRMLVPAASVYAALSSLLRHVPDARTRDACAEAITSGLQGWDPDAAGALSDCEECLRASESAVSEKHQGFADCLGSWVVTKVLRKPSLTEAENRVGHLVGGQLAAPFVEWWDAANSECDNRRDKPEPLDFRGSRLCLEASSPTTPLLFLTGHGP